MAFTCLLFVQILVLNTRERSILNCKKKDIDRDCLYAPRYVRCGPNVMEYVQLTNTLKNPLCTSYCITRATIQSSYLFQVLIGENGIGGPFTDSNGTFLEWDVIKSLYVSYVKGVMSLFTPAMTDEDLSKLATDVATLQFTLTEVCLRVKYWLRFKHSPRVCYTWEVRVLKSVQATISCPTSRESLRISSQIASIHFIFK